MFWVIQGIRKSLFIFSTFIDYKVNLVSQLNAALPYHNEPLSYQTLWMHLAHARWYFTSQYHVTPIESMRTPLVCMMDRSVFYSNVFTNQMLSTTPDRSMCRGDHGHYGSAKGWKKQIYNMLSPSETVPLLEIWLCDPSLESCHVVCTDSIRHELTMLKVGVDFDASINVKLCTLICMTFVENAVCNYSNTLINYDTL